jgi:hypothetical protein
LESVGLATLVFSKKAVAIVLLFAIILLTLFIAFQTCGSAAFFIVVFWAIAPFFIQYLYRKYQKEKEKARKPSKKGTNPPTS